MELLTVATRLLAGTLRCGPVGGGAGDCTRLSVARRVRSVRRDRPRRRRARVRRLNRTRIEAPLGVRIRFRIYLIRVMV